MPLYRFYEDVGSEDTCPRAADINAPDEASARKAMFEETGCPDWLGSRFDVDEDPKY